MRCKVGDLAILIGPRLPENLGALVEVLRPWEREPNHWWVRSLSGPLRRCDGKRHLEGNAADACLHPIRGNDGRVTSDGKLLEVEGA